MRASRIRCIEFCKFPRGAASGGGYADHRAMKEWNGGGTTPRPRLLASVSAVAVVVRFSLARTLVGSYRFVAVGSRLVGRQYLWYLCTSRLTRRVTHLQWHKNFCESRVLMLCCYVTIVIRRNIKYREIPGHPRRAAAVADATNDKLDQSRWSLVTRRAVIILA